jgi:hypothetical protein
MLGRQLWGELQRGFESVPEVAASFAEVTGLILDTTGAGSFPDGLTPAPKQGESNASPPRRASPDGTSPTPEPSPFILTPEQHEEVGHRFKAWDQKRSESHYRLARIIRDRLAKPLQ